MNDILEFQGQYRWLSNFWLVDVMYEGAVYPSVENAYQAAKVPAAQRAIYRTCTPSQAKRMGRTQPPDWVKRRVLVMQELIAHKFAPNTLMGDALVATGDVQIIEGNAWGDMFWGVCKGKGTNVLGKLIMDRRSHLKGLQG
jgi:ribA/ribD-fused uncharacterized protein